MSFETARNCRSRDGRRRRQNRAQWWFKRMRQAVDRAMDWQPTPAARPQQIWFSCSQRQISVAATGELRPADLTFHVCE